jgi:hypothetical protein
MALTDRITDLSRHAAHAIRARVRIGDPLLPIAWCRARVSGLTVLIDASRHIVAAQRTRRGGIRLQFSAGKPLHAPLWMGQAHGRLLGCRIGLRLVERRVLSDGIEFECRTWFGIRIDPVSFHWIGWQ